MLSWWEVAEDWRVIQEDVPHGMVEGRITAFAAGLEVTALTVRRAAAARRFAERLQREGRVACASSLRVVPISFMDRLARIERFNPSAVDTLLPRLLGGGVSGADVVAVEREVRERADRDQHGPRHSDGHRHRMASQAFIRRTLEAVSRPDSPFPGRLVSFAKPRGNSTPPLSVHGIVLVGEGERTHWVGIRSYAGSMDLLSPGRMRGALESGLALGRVFDGVLIAFEEWEEAIEMATTLQTLDPVGIGIVSLDEGGKLVVEHQPVRYGDPDLRHLRDRWPVNGEAPKG